METMSAPEGAVVHEDGKVYRRKPWKGGAFALVLIGSMADVLGEDKKPTRAKTFVPLVHKESFDPLSKSRKVKATAASKK